MSVPARICTKWSATAAVRWKRGSTATSLALRRVAAHCQDDIRVGDVGPAIRHCPSSERGGQTGHRGAVSYSCLLFNRDDTEAGPEGLLDEVVVLVRVGTPADHRHGGQRVDGAPLVVLAYKLGVAGLLDQVGDAVDRPLPGLLLPAVGPGSPVP